jgi:hypothetical protein
MPDLSPIRAYCSGRNRWGMVSCAMFLIAAVVVVPAFIIAIGLAVIRTPDRIVIAGRTRSGKLAAQADTVVIPV